MAYRISSQSWGQKGFMSAAASWLPAGHGSSYCFAKYPDLRLDLKSGVLRTKHNFSSTGHSPASICSLVQWEKMQNMFCSHHSATRSGGVMAQFMVHPHPRPLRPLLSICPYYDTFLLRSANLFTRMLSFLGQLQLMTPENISELLPTPPPPLQSISGESTVYTRGLQKSQDLQPPQAFQDSPVSFSSNFQESRPAEPPQINQLLKIMHLLL